MFFKQIKVVENLIEIILDIMIKVLFAIKKLINVTLAQLKKALIAPNISNVRFETFLKRFRKFQRHF